MKRALLIAGPTASGKSTVALALVERRGGTIVNADAMQVYRDLSVLTARPSEADERRAPHFLFGEVDAAENFSVGRWLARAREILAETREGAGPLLFVGGTGLYFRALTDGLSDIPRVPEAVRARVRGGAEGRPTPALHAELARRDPLTAARLRVSDRQRVLRALEVLAATGRPLAAFQGAREAPALGRSEWAGLFVAPNRDALNAQIDARFEAMLRQGALAEAEALMRRGLDPALPVMRARRAAIDGAFARRAFARRGRRTRGARDPPLRQAAIHLGAAPDARFRLGRARGRRSGGGEGARAEIAERVLRLASAQTARIDPMWKFLLTR